MNRTNFILLKGLLLLVGFAIQAKEIQLGGFDWTVRSGQGGPGPNRWDERNVWLDSATNLHLRISQQNGAWTCAEVVMQKRLGFGRYEFHVTGRLDLLDENVVLGLFNYPTGDVGPDGTHEIDIEFARWGVTRNPVGNFTVWPVARGQKQTTKSFSLNLSGDKTTHQFDWSREQILFQSLAIGDNDQRELFRWLYHPQEPSREISREPMPVHINLWLFRGRPPKNGRDVEIIIRCFKFVPE